MVASPKQQISVEIKPSDFGWYVATSRDLPGLFVANRSLGEVLALISEAIELIYLGRYQETVKATVVHQHDILHSATSFSIPVEILHQQVSM